MELIELIIFITTIIVFTWYCIFMARKAVNKYNNRIFVDIKTQAKYHVENIILHKDYSGDWHEIVLYKNLATNATYIREYVDFLREFKSLKEYEEEQNIK